jgi:ATP-binding cassette subfamily C protein CydD
MLQQGSFWLLDEPTASLDARSEKLVMQGIANNIENKTALLITHQLDQLKQVSGIMVMQSGAIVQSGTFSELAAADGLFSHMLDSHSTEAEKGDLDA